MKKWAKIIILTIIIVLWMVFIFNMSAKDSTQSSSISVGFTYDVLNTFFSKFRSLDKTTKDNIVESLQFIVRKGAHFVAYTILGGLCFVDCRLLKGFNLKKNFITAFLIAVIYAIFDEIHQYFVPGRACQFRDVMIDSCGAIFGICVVLIFYTIAKKLKNLNKIKKYG